MEYRGSTFAFVAGVAAGIVNLLTGLLVLFGSLILLEDGAPDDIEEIGILFFALTALNFAGGCACRSHRIAGGVMMLASALPLLLIGAFMMLLSVLPPGLFSALADMEPDASGWRAMLGIGLLLTLAELASGAAGVVCLAAHVQPGPYALTVDRIGVPIEQTSFAQQYAAKTRRS